MRVFRRSDQLRVCTKCGAAWVVPRSLLRRKRRRRGIAWRESHMFPPGALTNATAAYSLDMAKQRNATADATDDVIDVLAVCPSCGADTYVESPASGR